jgi:hypothetical protein
VISLFQHQEGVGERVITQTRSLLAVVAQLHRRIPTVSGEGPERVTSRSTLPSLRRRQALESRVKRVSERVPQKIETEHGYTDGKTGEEDEPG